VKTISVAILAIVASAACLLAAEQTTTVQGTLVSSACYLGPHHQTGNDMGSKKNCGIDCLKKGDPAGLLTKNNDFHVLVVSSLKLAPYVGQQLRVTGTDHNGVIKVQKAEVAKGGNWEEINLTSAE